MRRMRVHKQVDGRILYGLSLRLSSDRGVLREGYVTSLSPWLSPWNLYYCVVTGNDLRASRSFG